MTSPNALRWIPSDAFYRALVFGVGLHRADARKNAARDPYVSHLFSVCALVIEDGGSEEEAIAALLHDTVEDHGRRARLEQVVHLHPCRVRPGADADAHPGDDVMRRPSDGPMTRHGWSDERMDPRDHIGRSAAAMKRDSEHAFSAAP